MSAACSPVPARTERSEVLQRPRIGQGRVEQLVEGADGSEESLGPGAVRRSRPGQECPLRPKEHPDQPAAPTRESSRSVQPGQGVRAGSPPPRTDPAQVLALPQLGPVRRLHTVETNRRRHRVVRLLQYGAIATVGVIRSVSQKSKPRGTVTSSHPRPAPEGPGPSPGFSVRPTIVLARRPAPRSGRRRDRGSGRRTRGWPGRPSMDRAVLAHQGRARRPAARCTGVTVRPLPTILSGACRRGHELAHTRSVALTRQTGEREGREHRRRSRRTAVAGLVLAPRAQRARLPRTHLAGCCGGLTCS